MKCPLSGRRGYVHAEEHDRLCCFCRMKSPSHFGAEACEPKNWWASHVTCVGKLHPYRLGAANIVPILFRLAGTQQAMPKGLAVAALTTAGYSGMLAGPAVIGFFSKWM